MPRLKFEIRGALRIILWATGLGLLAHVLWTNRFSAREVLAHRPDGRYLVLAFAFCLAALVSTFVRWCILVRVQGLPLRFRDAVRVGFVGNAVDLIVPGQVGGDVVKAGFVYRTQERRTRAVASILMDRAVGILGLFALAGVMGAVNWSSSGPDVRRLILVVWAAVMAGTLGLTAALTPALIRPFDRLAGRHGRIRSLIAELHAVSQTYRDRKVGVLLGVAISTLSHALYALSFYAVSAALIPHPPSFAQHLQMVPLVMFTTVVPLPFGALGLSEQVSDSLFGMIGHAMGALAMLGYRLVALAVGCVSITVYLTSGYEIHQAAREGRIVG
jgi:uncharacterized protein (TIRG00374 family)